MVFYFSSIANRYIYVLKRDLADVIYITMNASVSSEVPNTETFIVSTCLMEPLMKHEARRDFFFKYIFSKEISE